MVTEYERSFNLRLKFGRKSGQDLDKVPESAPPGKAEPTSDLIRAASHTALRRAKGLGKSASDAAADAVSGVIRAADEISGEAAVFVRDAVVGVIEGTSRIATISKPVVREVTSSAVLSSAESGDNSPDSIKQAVEGAVVGAAKAGVRGGVAGAQASEGVVKVVGNIGFDFTDIVSPAIHGVITGVLTTSGNLFEATQETAHALVKSGADSNQDITEVAEIIVNEAIRATRLYNVGTSDAVVGAARGCVEAAYEIDRPTGEAVRVTLLALVDTPLNRLAPPIRRSISKAISDLAEEFRARPQFWRGVAMWRAAKQFMRVGGVDSGASLAYYTLLAFFPLTALFVLMLSVFLDREMIRTIVMEVFLFYFPGSEEFISHTLDYLYTARLIASILSVGGIILGTLGLFVAANRGVNRIFGSPPKRLYGTTISTMAIACIAVVLFMASMGFTLVVQSGLRLSDRIPILGAPITALLTPASGVILALVPLIISSLVFIIVFKYFPNQKIEWSDATFGGVVTVILFEAAKYIFLFITFFSQRELLYGPVSSVILLLVWSHAAGVIFLYGAAVTKQSSDLRPNALSLRAAGKRDALRRANIDLGRASWRDSEEDDWTPSHRN